MGQEAALPRARGVGACVNCILWLAEWRSG